MEGGHVSPPWLTEGTPCPRKHGEDVPTGEEVIPHSWPFWGQLAAAGSPKEVRRMPFSTHFFFLPSAILRTGVGRAQFALVFSPASLTCCFPVFHAPCHGGLKMEK